MLGWMDRWVDRWVDGWKDGQKEKRMERWERNNHNMLTCVGSRGACE